MPPPPSPAIHSVLRTSPFGFSVPGVSLASSITIDEQDSHETDEEDVKDCISRAADSVGLKDLPIYKIEMHDHTDWIKQDQESFRPVEIKEGLWIVPEWMAPPDLQAINIILNPGLSFGTGEHPTTKLCLLMLHGLIKGGEYFLDYGTGSGVLAIAALKFGAGLSVGFDIERLAITSAQHNAALNSVGKKWFLVLFPTRTRVNVGSMTSAIKIHTTQRSWMRKTSMMLLLIYYYIHCLTWQTRLFLTESLVLQLASLALYLSSSWRTSV